MPRIRGDEAWHLLFRTYFIEMHCFDDALTSFRGRRPLARLISPRYDRAAPATMLRSFDERALPLALRMPRATRFDQRQPPISPSSDDGRTLRRLHAKQIMSTPTTYRLLPLLHAISYSGAFR